MKLSTALDSLDTFALLQEENQLKREAVQECTCADGYCESCSARNELQDLQSEIKDRFWGLQS